MKPGNYISDISRAIQEHIDKHGFGIVRQLVGHGVGYEVHEEPRVPNYVTRGQQDIELKPGMVLAVEPMVNMGGADVDFLDDGWIVATSDGSLSAHFEHTIAITEKGHIVLTAL
jgi:methionyl aminopeptidase